MLAQHATLHQYCVSKVSTQMSVKQHVEYVKQALSVHHHISPKELLVLLAIILLSAQ